MKKSIMLVAAALSAGAFAMPAGFTDDWDAAMKKAAAEKKTVLALFTGSDWCIWCKRLEGEILSKKEFSDNVGKTFVPVFLDFPSDKSLVPEATAKRNKELSKKYKVRGFPTVLLLDSKGEVLAQTGYDKVSPEKYLANLNGLVKNGPAIKKYIKPYEDKLQGLAKDFNSDVREEMKKNKKDGDKQEEVAKAALKKVAGKHLAKITALKKELEAAEMPKEVEDQKKDLIENLDGAIKALTKFSKGELN